MHTCTVVFRSKDSNPKLAQDLDTIQGQKIHTHYVIFHTYKQKPRVVLSQRHHMHCTRLQKGMNNSTVRKKAVDDHLIHFHYNNFLHFDTLL